jgi:hypothetical protein
MWHKCSLHVPLCILTSSINTFKNWVFHCLNMLAMVRENVLVAFFSPNDITFLHINLTWWLLLFFFTSLKAIGIYQNPDCKSSVKNHWERPNWFKTSSIRGMGKKSFLVWKSMGGSLHKTFGYNFFSLAKSPCKHTLMHFYTSSPNPPMFVFVDSLQLPPNKTAVHESYGREVALGC